MADILNPNSITNIGASQPVSEEEPKRTQEFVMKEKAKTQAELNKLQSDLGKLDATSAGYYLDKVTKAQNAFQNAISNIKDMETVQTIIQAGAQVAASLYGLKNNLAIGKLDFAKSNFGQQYENAMEVLRQARERGKLEAAGEVMGQEVELKTQEKSLSEKIKGLEKEEGRLYQKGLTTEARDYQEKQTKDYRTWVENERVKADERKKKDEDKDRRKAEIRDLTAKKTTAQKELSSWEKNTKDELKLIESNIESSKKDKRNIARSKFEKMAVEYELPTFEEAKEKSDSWFYNEKDYYEEIKPELDKKLKERSESLKIQVRDIDSLIEERVAGKLPVVEDKKLNEVKQPTHGETVIQNGITYKWNYDTGKYEVIKQ